MKTEDLQSLQKLVRDMRFIQAAALVANGLNNNKQASTYMAELSRLDKVLAEEIKKGVSDAP